MNCIICEIRKPRRQCPGVHGDICTICCGSGREQTIDCPLDCIYLHDAHEHEAPAELDPAAVPNLDVKVTEDFLVENELLLAFIANCVFEGVIESSGATDWDLREALASLVQKYRTLQNGLYYEPRLANIYAARIADFVQSKLTEIQEKEMEVNGTITIRDSAVLIVLAFLQRLEYSHNNGRRKGRAFIDFLRGFYMPPETEPGTAGTLALPGPGIIL